MLIRRVCAEFVGAAFLLLAIVGSGIRRSASPAGASPAAAPVAEAGVAA
jgi:hypothetical protein